jgi:hypothetical protein
MRGLAVQLAIPVMVVLLVAGCVAPEAGLESPTGSSAPSGSPTLVSAAVPSAAALISGPTAGPLHLEASSGGLTMTADLDRAVVAPGGTLTVTARVRNDRPTPVTYGVELCGSPVAMTVPLALPLDPPGRTWTGIEGAFKTYALTSGYGPGGVPATKPADTQVPAVPCDGFQGLRTLAPGTTISSTLRWPAEITPGVPALPGEAHFELVFLHDPAGGPPSVAPDYTGPLGSWFYTYQQITLDGTFLISGPTKPTLTAGQAIDALLADAVFAKWLAQKPEATWSNANLFLESGPETKYQPKGAAWDIELFRESGVPRNFARAYVDPSDGHVMLLDICDAPCPR